MIEASAVKPGNVLQLEKDYHKVIESVVHSGGGKSGTMVHMKLRNLSTGNISERRFATSDKLIDVSITRTKMQYLYAEGDTYTFMNPATFDQIPIQRNAIGPGAAFLKENDELEVEFNEEKPLSVLCPSSVELRVASTGAGLRGQTDSTLKEAVLENDMKVLVPQFIKEGDRVRVEVETGKYVERVMDREEKGQKFTIKAAPQRASQKEEGNEPERKPDGSEELKK